MLWILCPRNPQNFRLYLQINYTKIRSRRVLQINIMSKIKSLSLSSLPFNFPNQFLTPPPKVESLLEQAWHVLSQQQTTQSYLELYGLVQVQLQKRVINISKIKQIGSSLYKKLSQDISKLQQNYKALQYCKNIQSEIKACWSIYKKLIKQLETGYQALVGPKKGSQNQSNEQKFDLFLEKYYIPYLQSYNKQVIPSFRAIFLRLAPLPFLSRTQMHSEIYNIQYESHHFKILEVLQRVRSIVTSQYQNLLSPVNSQTPEQESQTAIIFIAKLKNILAEMKGILFASSRSDDEIGQTRCTLQNMYLWASWVIQQCTMKVKKQYLSILGFSHKFCSQYYRIFQRNVKQENQLVKISKRSLKSQEQLQASSRNDQRISKTAETYQPVALPFNHYQSYQQIWAYLFIKSNEAKQLIRQIQDQLKGKFKSISQQISGENIEIQLTVITQGLSLIQSKIKSIGRNIYPIKIIYYQEIKDVLDEFIIKIQGIQSLIKECKIFIKQYTKHSNQIRNTLAEYIQINAIQKINPKHQDQDYEVACMRLNYCIEKLNELIGFPTRTNLLRKLQVLPILDNKKDIIKRIRSKILTYMLEKYDTQVNQQRKLSKATFISEKQHRNSNILIELDESIDQSYYHEDSNINRPHTSKALKKSKLNSNLSQNLQQSQYFHIQHSEPSIKQYIQQQQYSGNSLPEYLISFSKYLQNINNKLVKQMKGIIFKKSIKKLIKEKRLYINQINREQISLNIS